MAMTKHKKRLLLYGLLTLLIMVFIFCMSAQDGEHSGDLSHSFLGSLLGGLLEKILPRLTDKGVEHDIRKYAHMFEYFCLGLSAFLFFTELLAEKRCSIPAGAALSLALSFLYACTDEWHQTFVPGRAGRFSDVMVDTAGCLFGLLLICLLKTALFLDKRKKRG